MAEELDSAEITRAERYIALARAWKPFAELLPAQAGRDSLRERVRRIRFLHAVSIDRRETMN